ncbi:MAG: DUF5686 and carboxypeptidase regulatory-like domain-containing protein [Bacteroidales bacterium]|nr:DUF5686 and carboxypeptidase regulatory-like domain-containing protein [Bacteroidales bacterium]
MRRRRSGGSMCLLLWALVCLCLPVIGQNHHTAISGTVIDHSSSEPLAFVQVMVPNSSTGTVTDINGRFDLTVGVGDTVVTFRMVGYQQQSVSLKGRKGRRIKVAMEPTSYTLSTVDITASRTKGDRYRRKDNPAVELAMKVIAHKDSNNLMTQPRFSRQVYEKLNMCLDQFHPDFETHRLWKHFPFVEKYIDRAEFDGAEILHFSIRERMAEQEYDQGRMRTMVTGQRAEGVDVDLDDEGFDSDLQVLFAPADIFANEIDLMSVKFVSPLSSLLGNTFYHYYITDTVEEDSQRLIELSFIPSSKGNFGFVGSMYIVDDGTYAIRRYNMRVPEAVDLNFVRDLTLRQSYQRDSLGRYLPERTDVYCRFYLLSKRIKQIYVHQLRLCHDYAFDSLAKPLPDSLFRPLVYTATVPGAEKIRRRVWNATRPVTLSMSETFLDSIRYELMRIPPIRHTIHALQVIGTGYIPTSSSRDSSRFDFGSVYNFVSHNGLEGLRLRVGGMSTIRLSKRNFFDGYVAYGFDDHRPKFNLTYIHTFEPKRRYPLEYPLGLISFNATYEVESPGLTFDQFDRDNIFMWTDLQVPAQYVADAQVRVRKMWPSHIGLDTWVGAQRIEPTSLLDYYRVSAGALDRVDAFYHAQWCTRLSFSPNAVAGGGRTGEGTLLNLASNASSFTLGHEMGVLDGFYYNRTTANLFSRLWLSAFGYIDFRLHGGMIWNSVPLPKLFIPAGNASPYMSDAAFSTMNPMEYVTDRYVSLFATYHLKGLILNHIPLINRLRLREVLSFNILYGGLSPKNDPSVTQGLYQLLNGVHFLTSQPYAEYGIGIENILGLIRVDFVRRLTYLDAVSQPYAVKLSLRFAM